MMGELRPTGRAGPPPVRPVLPAGWLRANQEVPALLIAALTDHHFILQRSLSRGQLHSIRQEAGCWIKDMGVY